MNFFRYPAQRGFTLIEMMIVVAVITIIASVAYPSYTEYVLRGYRGEGQALLNDAAAAQERYYAQNYVYVTDIADIAKLNTKTDSVTQKYSLLVGASANDGGYTLTAIQQFNDVDCGNLTLDALGNRGRLGSTKSVDECWR